MQINYENYPYLRSAGFWNPPQIYNSLQEIDVPPVYAPYPTPGFWPSGLHGFVGGFQSGFGQQPYVPSSPAASASIAPNSGQNNTVGAAMSSASSAYASAPPATPAIAAATGQPLAPVSLVSPLPSITAVPNPVSTSDGGMCSFNSWVAKNPMLAAAGVFGVFLLMKGGKR